MTIDSETLQEHPIDLSDRLCVDRLPLAYVRLDADGPRANGIRLRRGCLDTPRKKQSDRIVSS
jgi:hypothetical protein